MSVVLLSIKVSLISVWMHPRNARLRLESGLIVVGVGVQVKDLVSDMPEQVLASLTLTLTLTPCLSKSLRA